MSLNLIISIYLIKKHKIKWIYTSFKFKKLYLKSVLKNKKKLYLIYDFT
jgi:hypothetical protein